MKLNNLFIFSLFFLLICEPFFIQAQVVGSFEQISGSPFGTGSTPVSIAYSPVVGGNLFAAVTNRGANTVSVYQVNTTTGLFSPVPGSPFVTGFDPFSVAYSPVVGGNLFAAVANGDDTISVYQVNLITGVFIPVSGSPFPAGTSPQSIAFSPEVGGNLFAAVTNVGSNNVSVYQVNTTTGAFTQISGSPFPTGTNPQSIAYSPVVGGNLFAAVANGINSNVSVYQVNTTTGAFTQVAGSPFGAGFEPFSVAYSPVVGGNLFAAVVNFVDNTVSVYQVNTATGAFAPVSGSPFATGTRPVSVAYSPEVDGNLFAAVANTVDNNVSAYQVNTTTGAFTQISGSPFATEIGPRSIAYSPDVNGNLFAAVPNDGSNTVSVYQVLLPPTVISIDPNQGPAAGGTVVTIAGTNFTGATVVDFGTTSASFTVNSSTQITAISPPGTGTVDITVITLFGTSATSSADQFTYIGSSQPLPPSDFVGKIKKNKFLNKTEYILIATWNASPSTDVAFYRIYKKGKVVATISANSTLIFETCLCSKHSAYAFEIAAVDSNNQESPHIKIVILHE